jgi:hypothetical protein
MRVTEALVYDDYWKDARFQAKQPNLRGSKKQAFGDNIYHRDSKGRWMQVDSHHSLSDGTPNDRNVANDTQTDRMLVSSNFSYWGVSCPAIPKKFRDFEGFDICAKRGHKNVFPEKMISEFIAWLSSLDQEGYCGDPLDWTRSA